MKKCLIFLVFALASTVTFSQSSARGFETRLYDEGKQVKLSVRVMQDGEVHTFEIVSYNPNCDDPGKTCWTGEVRAFK